MIRLFSLLFLGTALLLVNPAAKAESLTPDQKTEVETIIKDYLLKNPEVVLEALKELERRQTAAEDQRKAEAMAVVDQDLRFHQDDPVVGSKDAPITIVEFFDYQCGYCKRATPVLTKALDNHKDIRVVFKEFPIFGEVSEYAAMAALASQRQGLYLPFHVALMGASGKLTTDTVDRLAKEVGLDLGKLKQDMKDPKVAAVLVRNHKLGEALGIRGTPYMIVGAESVPGFIEYPKLEALLEQARKARG